MWIYFDSEYLLSWCLKKNSKSENFEIVFDELINDVNINVRSFDDENVTNDVSTVFDVRFANIQKQIDE